MSLTTERILLESKIKDRERQRTLKEIEADMHIVTIRQEASPLLEVAAIDAERLEVAVGAFKECRRRIKDIDEEIAHLKKSL